MTAKVANPNFRGEPYPAEGEAGDGARLDAAKAALAGSQKTRKEHEGAVADLKGKLSKYKGQLMEVKTNKEYTAVLHEIEGVERDIRARDDLTFAEMEKEEALAQEVKREDAAFKAVAADAATEKADQSRKAAPSGSSNPRSLGQRPIARDSRVPPMATPARTSITRRLAHAGLSSWGRTKTKTR